MLPLNITTPEETEETAAASATEDGVSRLPPHREEESCLNSLKDNTVQWKQPASSCVQPASLSPHKNLHLDTQPKKEKKCVKLVDSPANIEVLHEQSGNTPNSPRSVSFCLAASSLLHHSFLTACIVPCGSVYVPSTVCTGALQSGHCVHWSSAVWALCALEPCSLSTVCTGALQSEHCALEPCSLSTVHWSSAV